MKAAEKTTLLFILLMLSFSISGRAWNIAEHACHNSDYQVCVSSAECSCTSSVDSRATTGFQDSRNFFFSDVELGFKPVSETYSYANSLRLRRIIESVDIHKGLMQKFCLLRENLLVADKNKSCCSDKNPHYASVSCEYYIFTLRRILI